MPTSWTRGECHPNWGQIQGSSPPKKPLEKARGPVAFWSILCDLKGLEVLPATSHVPLTFPPGFPDALRRKGDGEPCSQTLLVTCCLLTRNCSAKTKLMMSPWHKPTKEINRPLLMLISHDSITIAGRWNALFYFLIFIFICLFNLTVAGLSCLTWDSSCGIRTLGFGMWDLVPWPRIKPGSPALDAWSLGHWTTREVLKHFSLWWNLNSLTYFYNLWTVYIH